MADESYQIEAELTLDEKKTARQLDAAIAVMSHALNDLTIGLDTAQALKDWEKLQAELNRRAKENQKNLPATSPLPASPSNSPPLSREEAYELELELDAQAAWDEIERLQNEEIELPVEADTAPAATTLSMFVNRPRSIHIDPKLSSKGLAQIGTQLAALSGARLASDGIRKIGTELGNLDRSLPKIAGVATGIVGISSAAFSGVGMVAAFTAGLSSLAGVAGLLPALLGAGGAAVGTLLASFKGVGEALKTAGAAKNAKPVDPKVAALQAEQAAQAVADAESSKAKAIVEADKAIVEASNAVADAVTEETQARLDNTAALAKAMAAQGSLATKAKRDARALEVALSQGIKGSRLEDLQNQARESAAALQDQANDTAKLAAQEAKNNSVSVNGSERVLDAQEKLAKAKEDRVTAEVEGTKRIEDALRSQELQQLQNQAAANAAGDAADEAMKKLTPSAQLAVLALIAVGAQLGEVQDIAQENFFDGFAAPLQSMVTTLLPGLKIGVGELATSLGNGFENVFASLEKNLGGGVLERMFGNTAQAQDILNTSIEPILRAFIQIGDVGSSFLPQLAGYLADAGEKFGAFIDRVAADGSLAEWIQGGIDGVKALWDILTGVAGILGAIGDAATAANDGGLAGFAATLHQVSDVMNSPEFQATLTSLFSSANAFFGEASKAIGPLGDMFTALAPTIEKVAPLLGGVLATALTGIATLLSDPAFQAGILALSEGLLTGITALLPAMGPLGAMLGSIAGLAGKLFEVLGPVLAEVFVALAPVVTQLVDALGPLVSALGDGLLSVLGAIMPLINLLLPVLVHFIEFLAAPDGLIAFIAFVLTQLVRLFNPETYAVGFEALMGVFGAFGEWFGNFFVEITNGWTEFIDGIPDWFVEITNGFMNFVDDLVEKASNFGKVIIDALLSGFRGDSSVQEVFGDLMGGLLDFLPNSPAKKGPLSKAGWDKVGRAPGALVDHIVDNAKKSFPKLDAVYGEIAGQMGSIGNLDVEGNAKTHAELRAQKAGVAGVTVKNFNTTLNDVGDPDVLLAKMTLNNRNSDPT